MESRPQPQILPPLFPDAASSLAARRRARSASLSTIAWILAGSFLVLLMGTISLPWAAAFRPVSFSSPADALLLVLAAFLALIIHELGHLLAAIACRFEVLTISLGALRFSRAQSGWCVATRAKRVFTGSVTAIPRTNEFWRERMMSVVAAGPFATFAGILLGVFAFEIQPGPGYLISFLLRAFIQISFVILLLGLIPNSPRAQAQNDAALFLILWHDGQDSNALFLYHLVLQHQRTGLEPRQFPLWLVELMAGFQGRADFMVLYAGMIASWAFDRGDQRSGDLWDCRALRLSAEANVATQHACLANSACFDLVFRNDPAAARAKLAKVQYENITSPSLQHRARAARDLAFGQIARSIAETSIARTFLPGHLQHRGYEWFLLKRLHSAAIATL